MVKISWKHGIATTLMLAVLSGGAIAAWVLSWDDDVNVEIISDGAAPLSATLMFSDMSFNTTLVAVEDTSTAQIMNADGPMNFSISINETIVDEIDSCDNTGDLNASWRINGAVVQDSGVVELPSGMSEVNMTLSAKQFSCPQNFTGMISLTATG